MRRAFPGYLLTAVLLGGGLILARLGLAPIAPHDARGRPASVSPSITVHPAAALNALSSQADATRVEPPREPATTAAPEISAGAFAEPADSDRMRALARENPAPALLALARTPPGEMREAMLEIVCAEVAQFDPAEAVSLASRFSGQNQALLENMVHQWAARDDRAAEIYAAALPRSELRNRLLGRVAVARAKTQPAEAAALVLAQVEPGDLQREALIAIVHEWSSQDPARAAAWVGRFPAGALRDRAAAEIRIASGR